LAANGPAQCALPSLFPLKAFDTSEESLALTEASETEVLWQSGAVEERLGSKQQFPSFG
jgi:hypothetical protein